MPKFPPPEIILNINFIEPHKTFSDAINANLSIIISTKHSISQNILQQFKEDVQKGLDDVENGNLSDGLVFINKLIEKDRNNAN